MFIEENNKSLSFNIIGYQFPDLHSTKNDYNYETLKETILNNTVEINTAETKVGKIVSIKCNQQDIFTYDDMNNLM